MSIKANIISKKTLFEYFLITLGVTIMAVAVAVFFAPYEMVTGGVTGLAIIIEKFTEGKIPIWLTNAVVNIPLLLLAIKARGFKFLAKTLYGTLYFSFALYFTEFIPKIEMDLFLVAVFGGLLDGIGLGLVFRAMGSTGGTDLIASIVTKYYPHFAIQKVLLAVDGCVIAVGLFTFGPMKTMYALIAVFILSKTIERILEGLGFAKATFIISESYVEISQELMKRLDRGVTALNGTGMYTGGQKNVLMCVVSVKEVVTVKDIVKEIDPNAFVIVTDVREVLGEGFQKIA